MLGKNFAYRDWYKDISKEWKPNISDVYLRVVAEKDPAIAIGVPFFDETGEVIGILVNAQRTISLSDLIKQVPLDPGTFITVTDRKGQIVYSSRHDFSKEILLFPLYPGIKKAMVANNKTVAVGDPDLGERTHYISFASVVNLGWSVFVGRDKRSILLSESTYYVQVTAISFLLFLSITSFLAYLRKQVLAQQILEQLKAEKNIRAGEEKLRALSSRQEAILAAVPEIIMEVDNNKVYTWANSAGIEFFGEDVIGKEADFYFEGEQYTYDTVRPLFNGADDIIYLESRQRRRDGQKRLLAWWCRVLKDESGHVTGALSSARDITERKQSEEEVTRTAREWQTTFDATNDSIWVLDKDQRVLRSNSAAERIFGSPMEAFIGKHCWEIVHGTNQPIPECPILRVKHSLRREIMELQIGDAWFEVAVDPLLDADGQYAGAVHIVSDITDRKRTEAALQESEEKCRALFENMAAASCLDEVIYENGKAVDYRIIDVNPAFEKIIGVIKKDTVGQRASTLYGGGEIPFLDAYVKVAETGHPISFEAYFPPINKYLHITASCPKKGKFSTVFSDITERKQVESQLNEQIAELQRWHNATLGRESRILDLKREVNELLGKAGDPPRYPSAESQDKKEE
jgi:PAS domain S-box-containing protein